jgi:proteasome subunit B (beta)-like protein
MSIPDEYGRQWKTNPYTVGIGIKCKDGIVLASDSLYVANNYKQRLDKVHKITDSMAVCIVGLDHHAHEALDGFKKLGSTKTVKQIVEDLHVENNLKRCQAMQVAPQTVFHPDILVADRNNLYSIKFIDIAQKRRRAFPHFEINGNTDTQATGEYGHTAFTLLYYLEKSLKTRNERFETLSINNTVGIAYWLIATMAQTSAFCEGPVQISAIINDENGYHYEKMQEPFMRECYEDIKDKHYLY